jgi:iron complex outermembrane receptor protein
VRHTAALSNPVVPSYTAVDLRYGWKPRHDVEVSITGQNLFGGGHGEFSDVTTRTQLERSAFVKLLYRF